MLRRDKTATLSAKGRSYWFSAGKPLWRKYAKSVQRYALRYEGTEAKKIIQCSAKIPIQIVGVKEIVRDDFAQFDLASAHMKALDEPLFWWLWKDKFYVTKEELNPADVEALVLEGENRKRSKRLMQLWRCEGNSIREGIASLFRKKLRSLFGSAITADVLNVSPRGILSLTTSFRSLWVVPIRSGTFSFFAQYAIAERERP